MQQTSYTTRVLVADEGHLLTQASDDVDILDRITTDKIFLAVGDAPDNWKEVTVAEADGIEAAKKAEADRRDAEIQAETDSMPMR